MLIGVQILMIESPPLVFASIWVQISSLGQHTNRKLFHTVVQNVMTEILWLKSLLHELHIQTPPPQIFSNNLGVVLLSANPVTHSKSKHFELDLHFVRDNVQNCVVQLVHIPSRFQLADPLTKLVSGSTFLYVCHKLKVVPNPTMSLREGVRPTVM